MLRAINSGGLPAERFGERGWWVIDEADLQAFVEKEVPEVEAAGSIGTLVVSTRCLADFVPILQKKISLYWRVALVVGAACEAKTKPALGTAVLVEAGKISRFERLYRP